jgi:hypothetical protein
VHQNLIGLGWHTDAGGVETHHDEAGGLRALSGGFDSHSDHALTEYMRRTVKEERMRNTGHENSVDIAIRNEKRQERQNAAKREDRQTAAQAAGRGRRSV